MTNKRRIRPPMSERPRERTRSSWRAMKRRCLDPRVREYPNYGGRGIIICERWLDFESFLADMGIRPFGLTLDRVDNDGNYEPGNCRWATRIEQNRNSRHVRLITFQGVTKCVREWEIDLNLPKNTIARRLFHRETVREELFRTPLPNHSWAWRKPGKLSRPQAEEIRRRYAAGNITQKRLAEEYEVDESAISMIITRKRHVV